MDLTPIFQSVIGLCAIGITAAGTWALARVAGHFKISAQNAVVKGFDDALTKAVQAGAGSAMSLVQSKGWTDPAVKSAVLDFAAPYMIAKFAPALASIGLDPTDPNGATTAYINAELNRVFPLAMAPVAASPVTPPAPLPATAIGVLVPAA